MPNNLRFIPSNQEVSTGALQPYSSVKNTKFKLQSISSSAMTSLKPFSIITSKTTLFGPNRSTIAKKRKPQVSVIDADEGPDEAVIVEDDARSKKDNRLVDVVFGADGEGLLVYFLVVANPDDVTEENVMLYRVAHRCAQTHIVSSRNKTPRFARAPYAEKVSRTILRNVIHND